MDDEAPALGRREAEALLPFATEARAGVIRAAEAARSALPRVLALDPAAGALLSDRPRAALVVRDAANGPALAGAAVLKGASRMSVVALWI
jgi:hypothetical protein